MMTSTDPIPPHGRDYRITPGLRDLADDLARASGIAASPPNVTEAPATRGDVVALGEATEKEIREVRRQVYDLQAKLSKWEQRFERWFQEEAAARLNPSTDYTCGEQQESPLHSLQQRLKRSL